MRQENKKQSRDTSLENFFAVPLFKLLSRRLVSLSPRLREQVFLYPRRWHYEISATRPRGIDWSVEDGLIDCTRITERLDELHESRVCTTRLFFPRVFLPARDVEEPQQTRVYLTPFTVECLLKRSAALKEIAFPGVTAREN